VPNAIKAVSTRSGHEPPAPTLNPVPLARRPKAAAIIANANPENRPRQNRMPAGDKACSLTRRLSKLMTDAPLAASRIPSAGLGLPLELKPV